MRIPALLRNEKEQNRRLTNHRGNKVIPGNRFYEANGNDDFRSPWEPHKAMPKPDRALCTYKCSHRLLSERVHNRKTRIEAEETELTLLNHGIPYRVSSPRDITEIFKFRAHGMETVEICINKYAHTRAYTHCNVK